MRCVEQGRWSGGTGHARSGKRAPLSVRIVEQSTTWERVHRFEQRFGATATGSLLDATRHAEPAAANLVEDVRPLPFQSGVLLCLAGQPVQLEAYDSPRTLAAVWTALLQAAALDALHMPAVSTPGGVPGGSSTRSTRSPSAASRPASVRGCGEYRRSPA